MLCWVVWFLLSAFSWWVESYQTQVYAIFFFFSLSDWLYILLSFWGWIYRIGTCEGSNVWRTQSLHLLSLPEKERKNSILCKLTNLMAPYTLFFTLDGNPVPISPFLHFVPSLGLVLVLWLEMEMNVIQKHSPPILSFFSLIPCFFYADICMDIHANTHRPDRINIKRRRRWVSYSLFGWTQDEFRAIYNALQSRQTLHGEV